MSIKSTKDANNMASILLDMRTDAKLSVRSLSRLSALEETIISALEHGEKEPTIVELTTIAQVCGYRIRIDAKPIRKPRKRAPKRTELNL
jgi:transcriptional regulator with XRE-family HTH domain